LQRFAATKTLPCAKVSSNGQKNSSNKWWKQGVEYRRAIQRKQLDY